MQEPAALLEQQLGVERLGGSGDTGVFLVRSGQVQAFFEQHQLLRGAPLLTPAKYLSFILAAIAR